MFKLNVSSRVLFKSKDFFEPTLYHFLEYYYPIFFGGVVQKYVKRKQLKTHVLSPTLCLDDVLMVKPRFSRKNLIYADFFFKVGGVDNIFMSD